MNYSNHVINSSPAWVVCDLSWEGAGQRPQRRQSSVEHRGNLSVHSSCPILRSLSPSGSILTLFLLNGPSPSNMAQIWAKWPKSKLNGPNPSKMAQIWSEFRYWSPKWWISGQIQGFLARFGPFCSDWGHYAWYQAILLGFGPYFLDLACLAEVRIGPEGDKALRMGQGGTYGQMYVRMYVRTDERTDSPCILQDYVPFGTAAQKQLTKIFVGLQIWNFFSPEGLVKMCGCQSRMILSAPPVAKTFALSQ